MEVRSSRRNGSFLQVLAGSEFSVLFSAYCREMGHALSEKDSWFKPITLCSSIALKTSKLHMYMKLPLLAVLSSAASFNYEVKFPRADGKTCP